MNTINTALARRIKIPSYYWMVCLEGIVEESEVPDYAGYIVVQEREYKTRPFEKYLGYETIRKAPRLHKIKLTDKELIYLAGKIVPRYWHLLNNGVRVPPNNDVEYL